MDTSITLILETTVVNWSHQLEPILQMNTLQEGNPTLYSELHFWKNRHADLENISSQMAYSKAQMVVELLEAANSTYFQPWMKVCKNISEALEDAENICKYMKPLQKQFERTESLELPKMKNHIAPLMVTVSLVWVNSKYHKYKSHFVFLLREIAGLLIKQALAYLVPEKLLSEDASDGLKSLQNSLDILQLYRDSYESYGANLTKYKKPGISPEPWSFDPTKVFLELNAFTVRLKTIKVDFINLSKKFNLQIKQLHQQFSDAYKLFTEKAADKCVDMIHKVGTLMEFEDAAKDLKKKTDYIYQQIGTIFCRVFVNASVPCNAFKMFGSLLEHPLIAVDAEREISSLLNMFDKELNGYKLLYYQHLEKLHYFVPIHWSFPPVAGEVQWAKNLKEQIQDFLSNLKSIPQV
uniref:Dynein heavy chain tail domain-containing protein n=1 Tax=Oryzias latipes TaxID=8090 RepID=A0A3P9HI63_ORYLA